MKAKHLIGWQRLLWIFLLVVGLLGLLTACGSKSEEENDAVLTESEYLAQSKLSAQDVGNGNLPLFYTNNTATTLYEVERSYDIASNQPEQVVETVLEDLASTEKLSEENIENIEDLTISSILPQEVYNFFRLREEEITSAGSNALEQQRVLEMHMTRRYYDMTSNARLVLRAGLSRTMFATGMVDKIEFWAPGNQETGKKEMIVATSLSTDNLIINQYSSDFYTDEIQVVLYFANAEGTKLVPEKRMLTMNMTEALPLAIMNALLEGPQTEGLTSVIPQGTLVEDVFMKDGVCYVDLSAEFQKNHMGGEQEENLTIYSIVNSLQDVGGIRYVQFLIEGKKVEYYKSYAKIDTFLEKNCDLVASEQ